MDRDHELGRGAIGCVLALVVVAIVAMIAYQAIPKRIAVAELQDYCEAQAERASLSEYTNENIQKNIAEKARELKLPVTLQDIHVRRDGGQVYVEVHYIVPLEFPGYTYRWEVSHDVARVLF
jgi:hypothetical protein